MSLVPTILNIICVIHLEDISLFVFVQWNHWMSSQQIAFSVLGRNGRLWVLGEPYAWLIGVRRTPNSQCFRMGSVLETLNCWKGTRGVRYGVQQVAAVLITAWKGDAGKGTCWTCCEFYDVKSETRHLIKFTHGSPWKSQLCSFIACALDLPLRFPCYAWLNYNGPTVLCLKLASLPLSLFRPCSIVLACLVCPLWRTLCRIVPMSPALEARDVLKNPDMRLALGIWQRLVIVLCVPTVPNFNGM